MSSCSAPAPASTPAPAGQWHTCSAPGANTPSSPAAQHQHLCQRQHNNDTHQHASAYMHFIDSKCLHVLTARCQRLKRNRCWAPVHARQCLHEIRLPALQEAPAQWCIARPVCQECSPAHYRYELLPSPHTEYLLVSRAELIWSSLKVPVMSRGRSVMCFMHMMPR